MLRNCVSLLSDDQRDLILLFVSKVVHCFEVNNLPTVTPSPCGLPPAIAIAVCKWLKSVLSGIFAQIPSRPRRVPAKTDFSRKGQTSTAPQQWNNTHTNEGEKTQVNTVRNGAPRTAAGKKRPRSPSPPAATSVGGDKEEEEPRAAKRPVEPAGAQHVVPPPDQPSYAQSSPEREAVMSSIPPQQPSATSSPQTTPTSSEQEDIFGGLAPLPGAEDVFQSGEDQGAGSAEQSNTHCFMPLPKIPSTPSISLPSSSPLSTTNKQPPLARSRPDGRTFGMFWGPGGRGRECVCICLS